MNDQKNEQPKIPQVKMPLPIFRCLVEFFLMGNSDPRIESDIINWLRDKQDANERRMQYAAKLAAEKEGGLPQKPQYRYKPKKQEIRMTQWSGPVKQRNN